MCGYVCVYSLCRTPTRKVGKLNQISGTIQVDVCTHPIWVHAFICVGVRVKIGDKEVVCRVKLLMAVADLPAKASILNCNQYNGKFGCSTCEHEGKQVPDHYKTIKLLLRIIL